VHNNPVNRIDPTGLKECCNDGGKKVGVNCRKVICYPHLPGFPDIIIGYPMMCIYYCDYCYEVRCDGGKKNLERNCTIIKFEGPPDLGA
jgi:hypothetical protein